jgi:hypothetical protein
MDLLNILAFVSFAASQAPQPALWLHPNGQILIDGQAVSPRFTPGARKIRTEFGTAYDFDGRRGGIHFGDPKNLKFTESFTVALLINARSYVNDGPGAQILFRGDDRNGHDPYTLVIHGNGTINFSIQNEHDRGIHVTSELAKHRWSQVVAHWESETGFLRMWVNGELVGLTKTSLRPFADLDAGTAPGFGIGNVQNEFGPHNQPFNGMLADVRIYRGAWRPEEIDFLRQPSGDPPPKPLPSVTSTSR